MTPTPSTRIAGAKGRRGSAMVLVLLLTFALAALAGSAILLSSTASQTVKSRESEKDLRYAADAAIAIGESQIETDPTTVPLTGYATLANNSPMLAADSTPIKNITYSLFAGQTGQVSRQNGRFVTVVAQALDTAHKRSFIRRVELLQESFARFAYFSNTENGICFGSGDVLYGPVFSNGTIATCSGQTSLFKDSVQAHVAVDSQAGATFIDHPQVGVPIINLPSTGNLSNLFTLAAAGNTQFTSSNANTDSTSLLRSRLEFDAYADSTPNVGRDSTKAGQGFVKFYNIDESLNYWSGIASSSRDSSAASYLRAGLHKRMDNRNCGDWHFVSDSSAAGTWSVPTWQFFPAAIHDSAWFRTAVNPAGAPAPWQDGTGQWHRFMQDWPAIPVVGLDTNFLATTVTKLPQSEKTILGLAVTPANQWNESRAVIDPNRDTRANAPMCYAGGDPHLVAMERVNWKNAGMVGTPYYGAKGGTDSTFTFGPGGPGTTIPAGFGMGRWSLWPSSPVVWQAANFKTKHWDWPSLFPIDTIKSPGFKGVIAVHGSTAISGNVQGHVTVYSDGNVGIVDDIRLTTDRADSNCGHGMGIVAGGNITALDNAINVPQHWALGDPTSGTIANFVDLRHGPWGGSLYVETTVMALQSWGAEGLNADSAYLSTVFCPQASPPDVYKRGCLYVFGSIIQYSRVTVNSGAGGPGGLGYAKQYQYDICAVSNPLPYFPTTGRLLENKYYEHDPNHFNVTALYQSLQGP